jgi:ABC-type transport system substrate-binding protein
MASLIQAMAREVGIDVRLLQRPQAQYEEMYRTGQHNIGHDQWWFPDPVILSTEFLSKNVSTFNVSRLADPAIDKLLNEAAAMQDERMRVEAYKKIDDILIRLVAQIPLVDQITIVGTRRQVMGYRFDVVSFPVLYDVYRET